MPLEDRILKSIINKSGTETQTINETLEAIVAKFVPNDVDKINRHVNSALHLGTNNVNLNTTKEAIWKSKNNKAPGVDEISYIMIKKA